VLTEHYTFLDIQSVLKVQDLDDSFVSDFVPAIRKYFQTEWFMSQSSSWEFHYKSEFTEVLTKRGFGFAFNMLPKSKLFTDKY
jgi:hypothetical protein